MNAVLEIRSDCARSVVDIFCARIAILLCNCNDSSVEDSNLMVNGRSRICATDGMCNAINQGIVVP